MSRLRGVTVLVTALMAIATGTMADDRVSREVDPNPLLMVSDTQFRPLADAMLRFDVHDSSGCSQLVYLTDQQRQKLGFNPKGDPDRCRRQILEVARPAVAAIMKSLPGNRVAENVDAFLFDPRVYGRVVFLINQQRAP